MRARKEREREELEGKGQTEFSSHTDEGKCMFFFWENKTQLTQWKVIVRIRRKRKFS